MAVDWQKRVNTPSVLAFLLASSVVLVVFDVNTRFLDMPRQVVTWATNSAYAVMNAPGQWISRASLYLQDRNEILGRIEDREQKYLDLEVQSQRLESLINANAELRQALALVQSEPQLQYVIAELSGTVSVSGRNEIFINRGTQHGVRSGMAVIDASGVYGQVVEALLHTSRVILIIDRRIAVPVQIQRSGLNAVATGAGNSRQLVLEHAEITSDIEEGDLLVASGLGDVYPFGYPVGIVIKIEPDASGVEVHVIAEPSASIHRRKSLLVVVGGQIRETTERQP